MSQFFANRNDSGRLKRVTIVLASRRPPKVVLSRACYRTIIRSFKGMEEVSVHFVRRVGQKHWTRSKMARG
jgi:hypothetical protein